MHRKQVSEDVTVCFNIRSLRILYHSRYSCGRPLRFTSPCERYCRFPNWVPLKRFWTHRVTGYISRRGIADTISPGTGWEWVSWYLRVSNISSNIIPVQLPKSMHPWCMFFTQRLSDRWSFAYDLVCSQAAVSVSLRIVDSITNVILDREVSKFSNWYIWYSYSLDKSDRIKTERMRSIP
jgi:hypothetical protein